MKSSKRGSHRAKQLGAALAGAGDNARHSGELALTAGEVIARRMVLGHAAMQDPAGADHAEFTMLVPEKAEAFWAVGMVLLEQSGRMVQEITQIVADETTSAVEATLSMAQCRTPEDLATAQRGFVFDWLDRVMSHAVNLGAMAVHSHGAAMTPVRRAAKANAKRLAK